MLCVVGVHSLAQCLGCGPVNGVVERALLGPLACGMHGCCRRCRRFIISRDRHCVLVRNAWALQPGGGWLRGVALAPPDCGGGCVLWWALVVVARAVGHWVTGAMLLCATPGPLGLVDGGCGGCWWCPPIAVAVARHRGRWWVVARERWEWGDRRCALARNAWVFRPGGQRRGMGATGGPRSSSSSQRPVVVAVGGSQPGRSTSLVSCASAQCQGLSTRWTVVWGGALGAVRLLPPSSWCAVVAFGGLRPGRSTVSVSHASVRRGVFPGHRELARGQGGARAP